jgi:hypothetical protein
MDILPEPILNSLNPEESMSSRSTSFQIATSGPVVRRALVLAAIVGTILVAINHGKCILSGHFNAYCLVSCILTMMVPYFVSTISSVMACRDKPTT